MSSIFSLTGSIATGKSTVAKYFQQAGVEIIDADIVAREVVVPGSLGLQQIIFDFGTNFLLTDGTLDRIKMGALVFSDPQELQRLNDIMVPLIKEETERQIHILQKQNFPFICLDGALLIEQGYADQYRPLVVVSTPFNTQLMRLMNRNNLTEEEARSRISCQLSSSEKEQHADYIISTIGTLEELKIKTDYILSLIKDNFKRQIVNNFATN